MHCAKGPKQTRLGLPNNKKARASYFLKRCKKNGLGLRLRVRVKVKGYG